MATLELRDEVDATHADESPSSPASLAAAIKEARDAIERSEELNKRLDPEEEPFRSKYLGREALKHAITKLEPHAEAGSDHASSWVARLEWRMGAVCQDVEETGRSVVHLSKALQIWRPRILDYVQSLPLDQQGKSTAGECDDEEDMTVAELAAYCAKQARKQAKRGLSIESSESSKLEVVELELEVVEAVSLLGIYHHNFEHHRQGLVLLKLAEALITGLETNLRAASASAESGVASGALLALRTQVVFYLAQAYAALHRAHDSAHYCQQTLLFQLEAETKAEGPESGVRRFEGTKFNADEWYKNCAGLVNYFINQDRYRDAEQCLLACDAVVTRHLEGAIPPAPAPLHQMAAARERLEEAEADMNRRWGIFYLNILKDAALEFKDKEGGEIEVETEEPPVSKVQIDFKGLNLGPCTAPLVSKVTSFEAARDVFKLCGARLAKAKAYYQLDGFVTDHVALCKDASCAFKWLAVFEQDEKRKTAMFGRALALLTPLLAQLGRQAYEGELKTLSWEAGEIATEMVEMKQERIAKKKEANPAYVPSRVEVQKSNAYCAQALEAFEKFAKFYRKAKPVPLFDLPKPGDEVLSLPWPTLAVFLGGGTDLSALV